MLDSPIYFELVLENNFFPEQDMNSIKFNWLPPSPKEKMEPNDGWEVLQKFFQNKFGSKEFSLNSGWKKAFFIADNKKKLLKAENFSQYLMENNSLKKITDDCFNVHNDDSCSLFKKELNKLYEKFEKENNSFNENQDININKGYYWEFYLDTNFLSNKLNSYSNGFPNFAEILQKNNIEESLYETVHDFLNNKFSPKNLQQLPISKKVIVITDEINKLGDVQNFINYLHSNRLLQEWSDLIKNFDRKNITKNLESVYLAFSLENELNDDKKSVNKIKI